MRAALYLRVSTDTQTTANQLPALQRYVAAQGWPVVETYIDEDQSGRKVSRPAFDRMLEDAKAKKFDVVVVAKLDRLSRSMKHLLDTLETLRSYGVAFASATQNLDTTSAAGELMFNILGAFAQFEATLISERTKAGLARVKASGKRVGRPSLKREPIAKLRAEGQTQSDVAMSLGISIRTVQRVEAA